MTHIIFYILLISSKNKKNGVIMVLSQKSEKLLLLMIGYYTNNVIFISIDDLDFPDETIYELFIKSYVQLDNKMLALTSKYITSLY